MTMTNLVGRIGTVMQIEMDEDGRPCSLSYASDCIRTSGTGDTTNFCKYSNISLSTKPKSGRPSDLIRKRDGTLILHLSVMFVTPQFAIHLLSTPHKAPQAVIMAPDGEIETRLRTIRLDGTLLQLDLDGEAFFKAETRIQDTEELRKHIIEVQEEAYKVNN